MNEEPICTNCEYTADFAGNYIECIKLHRFIDYYWWRSLSPDYCPKRGDKDDKR